MLMIGGGRIAVYYSSNSFVGSVRAMGGAGATTNQTGGPGKGVAGWQNPF